MKAKKGLIIFFTIIILALIIGTSVITKVREGTVGVLYSPTGGAKEILNPGWRVVLPWEDVTIYPTKITIVNTNISVTTKDGKKITMPVRYEMKVDKSKVLDIFKELGSQDIVELQEGYLYQKLFSTSRSVISSGYSVVDIYGTGAGSASAKVTEGMADAAAELGFIISDVTLGTPELDPATQAAIDARVEAAQQLEKLQLEKQIATEQAAKKKIEAQGEADKLLIDSQAAADAEIVRAEGEAKANKLLSESLTQEVIDLNISKARLDHGWVTVQGASQTLVEAGK